MTTERQQGPDRTIAAPTPIRGAADDSMVEELLSFCKEMIERPILLDAFKQIKDLSDDKLHRVLKMIKMIAEMELKECDFPSH